MTPDVHALTVRLPGAVYQQLRRTAFEQHVPMNQLVAAAVGDLDGKVIVQADDLRALLDAADTDYLSTDDLPDLEDRLERLEAAVGYGPEDEDEEDTP